MTIKIEKGVPIPARGFANGKSKYPWREMEVGDSFFAPGTRLSSVRSQALVAGRKYSRRYTSRTEGNGVRVWRIA